MRKETDVEDRNNKAVTNNPDSEEGRDTGPMIDDGISVSDDVNEAETLNKGSERENVFKKREDDIKNSRMKKALKTGFKVVVGILAVIGFLCLALLLRHVTVRPADDTAFKVDNPEDPLSYSNVAMSVDKQTVIPIYKFSVQGRYTAFDDEDVYSEYTFNFDPSGYFEGHSSEQDDDYGTWEITSDGESYYMLVKCTEAEDKYKLELADDGVVILTGKDRAYTLKPVAE